MFKDDKAKALFILAIEQSCYMKNSCQIDIENLVTNITYTEEKWPSESE
jgi:hypothetical protein